MDFHVTFLCDLCPSKFALVYNCDGFIINPRMWTDEFLEWDYVGAPEVLGDWRWELDRMAAVGQVKAIKDRSVVGSGKFSLRSKKFMEAGRNFRPTHCRFYTNREDIYLCGEKREGMIAQGVRFCPVGLASRFSRTSDDGRSLKWCFGSDGSNVTEDASLIVRELYTGEKKRVSQPGKKKILVLDGYDDNMRELGEFSEANHHEYAQRHGYDHVTIREFKPDLPPSWQKMENILNRMLDYDAIFWIDADAIVTNMATRIEDIIGDREGLFLSRDIVDHRNAVPGYFNAGVFVATSSHTTFEFLKEAMRRKHNVFHPWREKAAMLEVYRDIAYYREYVHVLPRRVLNGAPMESLEYLAGSLTRETLNGMEVWMPGDFVCHCCGPLQNKTDLLRKYGREVR